MEGFLLYRREPKYGHPTCLKQAVSKIVAQTERIEQIREKWMVVGGAYKTNQLPKPVSLCLSR
jgi:hypothetical protein